MKEKGEQSEGNCGGIYVILHGWQINQHATRSIDLGEDGRAGQLRRVVIPAEWFTDARVRQ